MCERATVGFSSDWMKKWREFCKPIMYRSSAKPFTILHSNETVLYIYDNGCDCVVVVVVINRRRVKKHFMLSASFRPEYLLETAWRSKDLHQSIRENLMQVQMSRQLWVFLRILVNEHKNSKVILILYMRWCRRGWLVVSTNQEFSVLFQNSLLRSRFFGCHATGLDATWHLRKQNPGEALSMCQSLFRLLNGCWWIVVA